MPIATQATLASLLAATATATAQAAQSTKLDQLHTDLTAATPAGTNSIGTVGLNAGSSTIGNVGLNAGSNSIGTVVNAAGANLIGAVTIGAATPSALNLTTAASTNATSVKSSPGVLFAVTVSNPSAAAVYLKLFNLSVAPTVGTSNPTMIIPVPATSSVTTVWGANGQRFTNGIALAVTGAIGNFDATAIAANVLLHGTYA